MATFSGLFVKNRAETVVVITKTPSMTLSKSRDLCLPAFAVVRPDAIQFVLVNSAVFGCLQLLLDPMHKFPHRPDNWFGRFYPGIIFVNGNGGRCPRVGAPLPPAVSVVPWVGIEQKPTQKLGLIRHVTSRENAIGVLQSFTASQLLP